MKKIIVSLMMMVVIGSCSGSGSKEYKPGEGSVALAGTATERRLCAALDVVAPEALVPLILAVGNDAESGVSLLVEGTDLVIHLSQTNNTDKVAGDISDMKDTCMSQAG